MRAVKARTRTAGVSHAGDAKPVCETGAAGPIEAWGAFSCGAVAILTWGAAATRDGSTGSVPQEVVPSR